MSAEKPSVESKPARRVWQTPVIECREVRPEVTAYAGADGPWLYR